MYIYIFVLIDGIRFIFGCNDTLLHSLGGGETSLKDLIKD